MQKNAREMRGERAVACGACTNACTQVTTLPEINLKSVSKLPWEWGSTFLFFRIRYITSQQRPNIIPQLNNAIDIIMVFLNSSLLASNNPVERSTSNGSLETWKTRTVGVENDFSQEKKEG